MASDGRQPPRRGRRMPVVGEGRQKERGAAGNRPHARGKRQTRGKSTARAPLRVGIECGRGERKKEGGGRTWTSAGRSCPPAGRLCRGAGLHLPPSASARLLTTPPSGPLPPGMPPASTLLFRRPASSSVEVQLLHLRHRRRFGGGGWRRGRGAGRGRRRCRGS